MRVTQRTGDELVIEEGAGANRLIGIVCTGVGAVGILISWFRAGPMVAVIALIFLVYGLKTLLFSRTHTHRFDRRRRVVVLEAKGRSGTVRRELPFDDIADVALEQVRNSQTHYLYYVTKQGERLRWADSYDGSRENIVDCFNAARDWLGMEKKSM